MFNLLSIRSCSLQPSEVDCTDHCNVNISTGFLLSHFIISSNWTCFFYVCVLLFLFSLRLLVWFSNYMIRGIKHNGFPVHNPSSKSQCYINNSLLSIHNDIIRPAFIVITETGSQRHTVP